MGAGDSLSCKVSQTSGRASSLPEPALTASGATGFLPVGNLIPRHSSGLGLRVLLQAGRPFLYLNLAHHQLFSSVVPANTFSLAKTFLKNKKKKTLNDAKGFFTIQFPYLGNIF